MAKVAYTAPGLTLADAESEIATAIGLSTAVAADLARIDAAITAAGQAASLWEGRDWWWLCGSSTFPTVASTGTYDLRTVNSSAMADLVTVESAWLADDYALTRGTLDDYTEWITVMDTGTGQPTHYALYGDMTMAMWPKPDAAYTVTVNYRKRHGKITNAGSTDAALIVPAEWHWPVYVQGGIWLIKHQNVDPMSLEQCPSFVSAMKSMAAMEPDPLTKQPGISVPPDTKVFWTGDITL